MNCVLSPCRKYTTKREIREGDGTRGAVLFFGIISRMEHMIGGVKSDTLINDFAIRCFRDVADQDYIAARMAYRAGLFPQFHWSASQAVEKYLKGILLLNRVKATDINHDLAKALEHAKKLPFKIKLSPSSENLIKHLDTFGRFRYMESSFYIHGPKLVELDKTVWEIRRYCTILNYEARWLLKDGQTMNIFNTELARIENSEKEAPQKFRLMGGGVLERILKKKDDPARKPLIWQNAFFGSSTRQRVRMTVYHHATNAPLTLHPEILEEVIKYVFLPREVVKAYREELAKRS